jgi:hypothetical protein
MIVCTVSYLLAFSLADYCAGEVRMNSNGDREAEYIILSTGG